MKTGRKSLREPGLSLLANHLPKNVSTIRRWIAERPELRGVLRVRRHGKQWRIDYPKNTHEFDAWLEQVRQAVVSFTRTPKAKSQYAKSICVAMGAGDEQRERDIEILRHAMMLKYCSRQLRTQKADTEEQAEDNPPSAAERESEAAYYWSTAQRVSAQFNCRVEDVPRYWREFCQKHGEQNRAFNAPSENWLQAHGLYKRAMQLLLRGSGELIVFIGAPRADGKPRVKLYRFAPRWKSSKAARWRTMYFRTEHLQLLPVASDAEIEAECAPHVGALARTSSLAKSQEAPARGVGVKNAWRSCP